MSELFQGWRSILTLIVLSGFALVLSYSFLSWRFNRRMKRGAPGGESYPPPIGSGWRILIVPLVLVHAARKAGNAWFARRDHIVLIAVTAAIMLWGFIQAVVNVDPADFGRSGALIVIIGFCSVFFGSFHARALFEARYAVDQQRAIVERIANSERAQGLSSRYVFLVTAAGTLLWGYGDLTISKETIAKISSEYRADIESAWIGLQDVSHWLGSTIDSALVRAEAVLNDIAAWLERILNRKPASLYDGWFT